MSIALTMPTMSLPDIDALTVALEPVQENDYDSVWPAGGGKNLFDQDTVYASYAQSDGSFLMTGGQVTSIEVNIPSSMVDQQVTFSAYILKPDGSSIANPRVSATVNGVTKNGGFVNSDTYKISSVTFTPTSTDDIVRITYGSNGSQQIQIKDVQLELGSSASTFEPYSNICPITGHSEVNVTRTGKNLLDSSAVTNGYYNIPDGSYIASSNWRATPKIKCKPSTTYSISGNDTQSGSYTGYMLYWDEDDNVISYRSPNATITTPANAYKFAFYTSASSYSGSMQIEEGSTVSAYAAYQGTDYTISLGQTVYGGTLDVLTGVLTVDRALYTFESTYAVSYNSSSGLYYWVIASGTISSVNSTSSTVGNYISNMFVSGTGVSAGKFYVTSNGQTLVVVPWSEQQSITTVADATAWLADNPLEVCIPLATPTTIQLTAQDVETLTGINNVWSDSGDVTVTISGTTQSGDVVTFTAVPQRKIQLFLP